MIVFKLTQTVCRLRGALVKARYGVSKHGNTIVKLTHGLVRLENTVTMLQDGLMRLANGRVFAGVVEIARLSHRETYHVAP